MTEVVQLRCDDVRVPEQRLRALKTDDAWAIGESIKAHGQFDPIKVVRDPKSDQAVLVDGWHRLEGCRLAGVATVQAIFIRTDKAGRVKHEAISGIARATHDVFDRAAAIDALARIARAEAGLPEEGDLRKMNGWARSPKECEEAAEEIFQHIGKLTRWDMILADRLGCGIQTIRSLTTIHHRIHPDHKAFLRQRGQADRLSAVLAFARLTEADMCRVWNLMNEDEQIDLASAIAALNDQDVVPTVVEKAKNAFLRKVAAWPPFERKQFWHEWQQEYHPDGRRRSQAKG